MYLEVCSCLSELAEVVASQSSTYGAQQGAEKAIDGNNAQNHQHCTHTNQEDKAWWQVDLGKTRFS